MGFLGEGAVKDLLMRGPDLDELVWWANEYVLAGLRKPYAEIKRYGEEFDMTPEQFKSFCNIQLNMGQPDEVKDVLREIVHHIDVEKMEKKLKENVNFERGRDPKEQMDIGQSKWRAEEYFWGNYPYKDLNDVVYLETEPTDPEGNRRYRAVMYKDPKYSTPDQFILAIEKYQEEGRLADSNETPLSGWDRTPGSWFLSTLLGEYSSGPRISDRVYIDGGQNWYVENILAVLEEAKEIRNNYQNKNRVMKESIEMPRFRSFINEDYHKEASDEAAMAKVQLKSIMKDATEILQGLESSEQLDAWVQSKLSVAEDYLSTIRKYMEFEEEKAPTELPLIPDGPGPDVIDAIPAENPIEDPEPEEDIITADSEDIEMAPMNIKGPAEEPNLEDLALFSKDKDDEVGEDEDGDGDFGDETDLLSLSDELDGDEDDVAGDSDEELELSLED